MEHLLQNFERLLSHGLGGFFGLIALIIFYIVGFVSVLLAIGMLIYSLFSKNWNIWRKWKYVGYLTLIGIGFWILGITIKIITTIIGS